MLDKIGLATEVVNEVSSSPDHESPSLTSKDEAGEKQPLQEDWPREPVSLIPTLSKRLTMMAYDIALLLIPALLMVKTGIVILAWKTDREHIGDSFDAVSQLTTRIIQVNGQLITIFTIVFVTVVSTLVKRYALYKAQIGATVDELEQLQGSVSLPSTIKLIWALRAFRALSLVLFATWSFQYLGSQANKFEYRFASSGAEGYNLITICGANSTSIFELGQDQINTINPDLSVESVNVDFRSAVKQLNGNKKSNSEQASQSAVKVGSDSSKQALVPDLAALLWRTYNTESDPNPPIQKNGWYNVARQSSAKYDGTYVSMVGSSFTSVGRRQDQGNVLGWANDWPEAGSWDTQFLGEYTVSGGKYINFTCAAPQVMSYSAFPNNTLANQGISLNMTQLTGNEPRDRDGAPLRSVDFWIRSVAGDSGTRNYSLAAMTRCSIKTVHYDLQVECGETGCSPKKMRWSNGTDITAATSYSTPFDNQTFAGILFSNLLLSYGSPKSLGANNQTWIGTTLSSSFYQLVSYVDVDNPLVPQAWTPYEAGMVEHALGYYINSYYGFSLGDYQQFTPCRQGGVPATFKGALLSPRYVINWVWIALDFISCGVLFAAGVVSILLRTRTLAPDVLGAVSSITRNNPYIKIPNNGTTLPGVDRAKLMRHVKVMFADVSGGDEEVGRIALVSADEEGQHYAPLKKTTKYA